MRQHFLVLAYFYIFICLFIQMFYTCGVIYFVVIRIFSYLLIYIEHLSFSVFKQIISNIDGCTLLCTGLALDLVFSPLIFRFVFILYYL